MASSHSLPGKIFIGNSVTSLLRSISFINELVHSKFTDNWRKKNVRLVLLTLRQVYLLNKFIHLK